jgi:hypothetical protein
MDKHRSKIPGRQSGARQPLTTLTANGTAGAILILGAGIAYFLNRASPEALAMTSTAMITTGLVGLLLMAAVAIRLSETGHDDRGGHGRGPDRPPPPTPAPTTDDLDAELFRIIDEERLRDTRATSPDVHPGLPANDGRTSHRHKQPLPDDLCSH